MNNKKTKIGTIDLIVLAAGNQTRFGNKTQKGLVELKYGESVVRRNLRLLKNQISHNIIVTSGKSFRSYVHEFLRDPSVHCPVVESGRGSGHAFIDFLSTSTIAAKTNPDYFLLMWSDVVLNSPAILDEMIEKEFETKAGFIIPLNNKKNPYVHFNIKKNHIDSVEYDSTRESGKQDLSLFLIRNVPRIINPIYTESLLKRHQSFQFLDIFNSTIKNTPSHHAYVTRKKTHAYNTYEEFKVIKEKLKCYLTYIPDIGERI